MDRITPDNITSLKPNEIFVFGSNEAGIHGVGAAKQALMDFGAKWGVSWGQVGSTYAIPTKDINIETLPIAEIRQHVKRFIHYALYVPSLTYLVTEIGCGLAGYTPAEIAPLFVEATVCKNVWLPQRFWDVLNVGRAVQHETLWGKCWIK